MDRNLISTDWGPHTFWDSAPLAMKAYIWALMENGITVPLFGKSLALAMRKELEGIEFEITGLPLYHGAYFAE